MELTAIKNKTMAQRVVDQIYTHIAAGSLKPGDVLPVESKLAETFNIGKSTIREALRILETQGVIKIQPRKGILISSIPEGLSDTNNIQLKISLGRGRLSELRECLEMILESGARLACQKSKPKDINKLNKTLEKIENLIDLISSAKPTSKTQKKYEKLYFEFYSRLAEATHNILYSEMMNAIFSNIMEHLPLAEIFFTHDIRNTYKLLKLDQELLQAIEARDCLKSGNLGLKKGMEINRIISDFLAMEPRQPIKNAT